MHIIMVDSRCALKGYGNKHFLTVIIYTVYYFPTWAICDVTKTGFYVASGTTGTSVCR